MSIQRRNDELEDLLLFPRNDGTYRFVAANGSAAAPAFTFGTDLDTGFYRRGANEIGIATLGVIRGYWGLGLNIGTATEASATVKVAVGNAGSFMFVELNSYSVTTADGPYLNFLKSHSDTQGTKVATVDTELLGAIQFVGQDTAPGDYTSAWIKVIQDGVATATRVPAKMEFVTSTGAARAVRFMIAPDGGIFMYNLKAGANQGAAGAATDELWVDTDDQTIKLGT